MLTNREKLFAKLGFYAGAAEMLIGLEYPSDAAMSVAHAYLQATIPDAALYTAIEQSYLQIASELRGNGDEPLPN